ncbi:MAG: nicotinamide riboside transporter PnuC [Chamaesiphon sp.]
MSFIEIVAAIFGLLSVWLTVKENIWCWPTGLVMVFLYIFIFYQARLYSDVILQVIYVFLQSYGWYTWLQGGKERGELHVTHITQLGIIVWSAVAIAGIFSLGFVMDHYTNAALPYWDAAITVISLIAQWLMAFKVLESWLLWITVDVLALGVYAIKKLYVSTGLYAVFLVLAVLGFLAWKKPIN